MGPLDLLLKYGANIVAVDLDRPAVWEKILRKARASPGRVIFPVSAAKAGARRTLAAFQGDDEALAQVAGANLLGAAPELVNIRSLDEAIVIGAGLAGWTTIREFRKLDPDTPVTLITADSGDFYAKPTLSNAFAQQRGPTQLVTTPAARMAETLKVTLLAHTEVLAIDPAQRRVRTGQGEIDYRDLVLATGAHAIRLPLAGDAAEQVLSVNSLDDFAAFCNKSARRCSTYTHCSAGDDRYFIFQPHLPISFLSSPAFSRRVNVVLLMCLFECPMRRRL
jgi:hypothetical protein